MGTPPPAEYIEMIVDYLLISHPSSDAYISHTRSAFYFLHSSIPSQLADDLNEGDNTNRKFSTWNGRDKYNKLAQPVDAATLSTALRNVQTIQIYGENYNKHFNTSSNNIDSGISGSLRENNSVENNRSIIGLFDNTPKSSGIFGSFRRNSLSQHYENLFFKKQHLHVHHDSEDTVEESASVDNEKSRTIDETDFETCPSSKSFNVKREPAGLDLKLFDFINKCKKYALNSDKKSPDKEIGTLDKTPSIEELENTLHNSETTKLVGEKTSMPKHEEVIQNLEESETPQEPASDQVDSEVKSKSPENVDETASTVIPDKRLILAEVAQQIANDIEKSKSNSPRSSKKYSPMETSLEERETKVVELPKPVGPTDNIINLSENRTNQQYIQKLLSDLNTKESETANDGLQKFGEFLSDYKRRSLLEIIRKDDQSGEASHSKTIDTIAQPNSNSNSFDKNHIQSTPFKEENEILQINKLPETSPSEVRSNEAILNTYGECNEEDIEISSLSGHEMLETTKLGYNNELPRQYERHENTHPYNGIPRERLFNEALEAAYDISKNLNTSVEPSSQPIETVEQLFEVASKTNILFNNSNLLQSKQEILLSALSISDIGADSDQDDLESDLADMDEILNENLESDESQEKQNTIVQPPAQYILNDGLILLLRDIILVLPDNMIESVFNKIISFEILLLLSNHKDIQIRISVLKLLYSYLQRSCEDELVEFIYKNKGFYLLSNQISLYPPNMELANMCVMFLTDCHWLPLQEQLNYANNIDLTPKQLASIPLVLALLNISVNKFQLCLQLLQFIDKLIKKITPQNLNKLINDYGLIQCVLKVLIKITHENGKNADDVNNITKHDVLLDNIDSILINITTKIIQSTYNINLNTQIFNNIILYITYVENIELSTCGNGSKCYVTLKNIHRTLLEYTLDRVQDTITKHIYTNKQQSVTSRLKRSLLSVVYHSSSQGSSYERNDEESSEESSVESYPPSSYMYPGGSSHPSHFALALQCDPRSSETRGQSTFETKTSPPYDHKFTKYVNNLNDRTRHDSSTFEPSTVTNSATDVHSAETSPKKHKIEIEIKRNKRYEKSEHKIERVDKFMQKSELIERYKTTMSKCVDYIINSEPIYPLHVSETNFICHMLVTMLLSINSVIEKKKNNTNYSNIMWNLRQVLRTKTSQLIIWMLEPNRPTNLRIFLINTLKNEIYLKEILTNLFLNNNLEIKFILFVWELIHCCKLTNDDLRICYEFENKLKSIVNHEIGNAHSKLNQDVFMACREFKTQQNEWILNKMNLINKIIVQKYEKLIKTISENCIAITGHCLSKQNNIQKNLLNEIKTMHNKQLYTKDIWNSMVASLTHEKAPWHFENSYPKSWKLDEVEGPERIRIRFKRCHLFVKEKYLLPEYRNRTLAYQHEQPLEFLVKENIKHESMVETVHTNEKVTYMCCANLITPSKQIQGELLITSDGLKFIPFNESYNFVTSINTAFSDDGKSDNSGSGRECETEANEHSSDAESNIVTTDSQTATSEQLNNVVNLNEKKKKSSVDTASNKTSLNKSIDSKGNPKRQNAAEVTEATFYDDDIIDIDFTQIKEIHNRRYNLQEKAVELFLLNNKNYLFTFENHNDREHFLKELSTCSLPNRTSYDLLGDTIQLWCKGHLTNWSYLMILNKLAGRSYNDLMQYPVLPFILSDYKSTCLDLTNPKSFRNLEKPMAVQDKKNEGHYINNYNYLQREMCDAMAGVNQEPYHYGSHYSNSGTVLHFLVRIPPYTSMFLNYQDNNFDLPDRTFHNLATTWRLTSSDSTTDVKELIPELFYLSDMLVNNEGFDFGIRQNGQRVDNVILPAWAPDPRTFIMVHRQALESEIVSENLPHWIDLVFGYKQSGKHAVDAINVFHPATYYGFDISAIPDPLERTAWETMIRTYGQTPRQLFKSAHPMNVKKLTPQEISSVDIIPNIKGLVWGNYVGSPDEPPPVIVWKDKHRNPVSKLIPLKTNDVFGLAKYTTLLHSYHKEKNTNLINNLNVIGAGMICWNENDNIIRIKIKKELPATPVVRPPRGAVISTATTAPDVHALWLGLTNGNILVYQYDLDPNTNKIQFKKSPTVLLGHTKNINDLYLSASFSIAISASEDGSCILWDVNTLTYIRNIPEIDTNFSVTNVSISETNGEIASIVQNYNTGGSILRLHTINTELIASVLHDKRITSVTFSNAPEGISQNVILTGHIDGTINIYSGYKLDYLSSLNTGVNQAISSLTYSYDGQHLYASNIEGLVVIWESSKKYNNRTPKFSNLTLI